LKWNNLWSQLRIIGFPFFLIVAIIGYNQMNVWYVPVAFIALVAPLPPLYVWRWKRVQGYRTEWEAEHGMPGEEIIDDSVQG